MLTTRTFFTKRPTFKSHSPVNNHFYGWLGFLWTARCGMGIIRFPALIPIYMYINLYLFIEKHFGMMQENWLQIDQQPVLIYHSSVLFSLVLKEEVHDALNEFSVYCIETRCQVHEAVGASIIIVEATLDHGKDNGHVHSIKRIYPMSSTLSHGNDVWVTFL